MNWHEYFMNIAKAVALKSKDPSSKVGTVIVDKKKRPISFGFNGFVAGCDEGHMTFERPLKYNLIIHSEMNAIIFANRSLEGCVLYSTHGPCDNCLKHILQSGVRTIWYNCPGIMRDRGSKEELLAIEKLITATGISVRNVNTGRSYLQDLNIDKQRWEI